VPMYMEKDMLLVWWCGVIAWPRSDFEGFYKSAIENWSK